MPLSAERTKTYVLTTGKKISERSQQYKSYEKGIEHCYFSEALPAHQP